jgi:D-3-phosphoglycerate dehydrogenase
MHLLALQLRSVIVGALACLALIEKCVCIGRVLSMFKVLVTDYHWSSLEIERRVLAEVGAELIVAEQGDEAELIALAPQADAILFCWKRLSAAVLDAAVNCRIASRYGVGLDNVDVAHATRLGIPVTYVSDYCMEEVSDHAMALLLACARSIPTFDRDLRRGEWNLSAGRPMFRLRGRTLGIIGYGNIGRTLAPKALGFGMRVLAYGRHDGRDGEVTITSDLSAVLRQSDYVSLHLPLNDVTRGMVNADFLRQMKPTSFLINTARGGLIDEPALVDALSRQAIAGVALDVLIQEPPPPDHPLLKLDNVLLTPHAAFSSEEALAELQEKAARHVVQALRGDVPDRLVNPAVLEQSNCRLRLSK